MWSELKTAGWGYRSGCGHVSWYYLRPGCSQKLKDLRPGLHFFASEEEVVAFARLNKLDGKERVGRVGDASLVPEQPQLKEEKRARRPEKPPVPPVHKASRCAKKKAKAAVRRDDGDARPLWERSYDDDDAAVWPTLLDRGPPFSHLASKKAASLQSLSLSLGDLSFYALSLSLSFGPIRSFSVTNGRRLVFVRGPERERGATARAAGRV